MANICVIFNYKPDKYIVSFGRNVWAYVVRFNARFGDAQFRLIVRYP